MSDLYAMGVTECDNMLMLLGVSTKMTEKERDVVVPLMMRGFKVFLKTSKHSVKLIKLCLIGLRSGSRYNRHGWSNCPQPLVHYWWGGYHRLPAQRVHCVSIFFLKQLLKRGIFYFNVFTWFQS